MGLVLENNYNKFYHLHGEHFSISEHSRIVHEDRFYKLFGRFQSLGILTLESFVAKIKEPTKMNESNRIKQP